LSFSFGDSANLELSDAALIAATSKFDQKEVKSRYVPNVGCMGSRQSDEDWKMVKEATFVDSDGETKPAYPVWKNFSSKPAFFALCRCGDKYPDDNGGPDKTVELPPIGSAAHREMGTRENYWRWTCPYRTAINGKSFHVNTEVYNSAMQAGTEVGVTIVSSLLEHIREAAGRKYTKRKIDDPPLINFRSPPGMVSHGLKPNDFQNTVQLNLLGTSTTTKFSADPDKIKLLSSLTDQPYAPDFRSITVEGIERDPEVYAYGRWLGIFREQVLQVLVSHPAILPKVKSGLRDMAADSRRITEIVAQQGVSETKAIDILTEQFVREKIDKCLNHPVKKDMRGIETKAEQLAEWNNKRNEAAVKPEEERTENERQLLDQAEMPLPPMHWGIPIKQSLLVKAKMGSMVRMPSETELRSRNTSMARYGLVDEEWLLAFGYKQSRIQEAMAEITQMAKPDWIELAERGSRAAESHSDEEQFHCQVRKFLELTKKSWLVGQWVQRVKVTTVEDEDNALAVEDAKSIIWRGDVVSFTLEFKIGIHGLKESEIAPRVLQKPYVATVYERSVPNSDGKGEALNPMPIGERIPYKPANSDSHLRIRMAQHTNGSSGSSASDNNNDEVLLLLH
jgi:hypothetical protein